MGARRVRRALWPRGSKVSKVPVSTISPVNMSYAKRAAKSTETPGRTAQWMTAGAVKIMGAV